MFTGFQLHRKRALIILLFVFALASAIPAQAQLGLGLVPMRLELKMTPGQQYSGSLKLSSESGGKVRIRAEVLDFNIDATATPQFERDLPPEAATSCKKWLSLNPREIEIAKGGFLNVRYTFRLPADLPEGSYNCAAGFSTLPPAEQVTGMGMRMAVRIVAAFYIVVGSPSVRGMLKEIKLEPLPPAKDQTEGGWQAVVVLENQGPMYFRPAGKLEVLDAAGKVVETADIPSLPVLRERDQRFLFPLKTHLEAGHYKLRVNVDIGTGEIQRGTVDVAVEAPAAAAAEQK
jgi:P pilus assembly chaperone PapD